MKKFLTRLLESPIIRYHAIKAEAKAKADMEEQEAKEKRDQATEKRTTVVCPYCEESYKKEEYFPVFIRKDEIKTALGRINFMECKTCKELICVVIDIDTLESSKLIVNGFKIYEKGQKCLNGTEKEKN